MGSGDNWDGLLLATGEPESPSLLQALVNQPTSLSRLISAHGQVKGQRTNRRPRSLRLQDRSRPVWVPSEARPHCWQRALPASQPRKAVADRGSYALAAREPVHYPLRPAPGPTISHGSTSSFASATHCLSHLTTLTHASRDPGILTIVTTHAALLSFPTNLHHQQASPTLTPYILTTSQIHGHTPWSLESLLSCTGSRPRQILLSVVLPVPASIILVDNYGPFHHIYPP